ncbi:hypothetical protein, partial [Methanolobus chelungpuianus]|uniref:hypothetical protein n=1 Tax=Methanolobus chelungpuianus TaxID=502115 RepID=UPI0021146435
RILKALRDNPALFRHISTRILTIGFNPISMLRSAIPSLHTAGNKHHPGCFIYAAFAGGARYTKKDINLT